ncbi:MAG TPA: TetR family transcriptional regulator C-terminal domain-containing protein [Streptosporangiaceae bacterium]
MTERAGAVADTADQRREQMLRAALDVIEERGFPDTRIADVAARAGTSPALVIYYFKTKDNLLTEAMRYAEDLWYDLGARRMEVIESAAARLEEIVAMTCLSETDTELPDSWALWLDLWAQSVRHPEVARVREEFDAHWRETIASVVREGIATGEFEKVDATRFAITLSALLDGFAIQIALEDPAVDPQLAFRSSMDFAAMTLCFAWKPKKNAARKNGVGRR